MMPRSLAVLIVRLCLGSAAVAASLLMPAGIAGIVAFAGKALMFLGVFAAMAPAEAVVTGALADLLLTRAAPLAPYATSLDSYTDEAMAAGQPPLEARR